MRQLAGTGQSSSLKDFKQLALLGEGAYSTVFKVLRLSDQKIYSLKKVKLPSLSEKEKQNSLNEVRLLASVQHENVIAYKEAFLDEASGCLCIVTEFADGGDLYQKITQHQKLRTFFRESDVWHCLFGMLHGLKTLHDMKILHRDMKCANVFLGSKGEVKLGDFNVSKVAKRGLCMTQTGTPYYASPEVWRDMPYDAKSDMWSLGCILYEMVALRPPFRADDMEALYRKVLKGQYPRIPSVYSRDVSEAIAILLQVNPRQRPNVDQFMAAPVTQRHVNFDSRGEKTYVNQSSNLLQTIKLPENCLDAENLSNCLPKPRYEIAVDQQSGASNGDAAAGTEVQSQQGTRQLPQPQLEERRILEDGRLKDALDSLLGDNDAKGAAQKAESGEQRPTNARDYDKLAYQLPTRAVNDHDNNPSYSKRVNRESESHGHPAHIAPRGEHQMAVHGAPASKGRGGSQATHLPNPASRGSSHMHVPDVPNQGNGRGAHSHNYNAGRYESQVRYDQQLPPPNGGYDGSRYQGAANHDHRYPPSSGARYDLRHDIERCYGQRQGRPDRPELEYRQRYEQQPQRQQQQQPPQHGPQHGNYNNEYYYPQRQAPQPSERQQLPSVGVRRQLTVAGGAVSRNKRPDQNRPYLNRQQPATQNRRQPAGNYRLLHGADRPIRVY
eukprot:GEMP01005744.1.p1 GENE.GEMP01005744.1~~GEMP01005744.1.p1  ORF type:complete len:667 (+),score=125.66 GEMP01005744.1:68-2068(+)